MALVVGLAAAEAFGAVEGLVAVGPEKAGSSPDRLAQVDLP